MRQELSNHISNLLFKVERLSIPQLGSFELSQAPALVDQVQGQVAAPAMDITFNPNLVLDDGILTEYLVAEKNWSTAEAQAWVERAVQDILAALDRREIIELPGVGRFFRNFEGKLQFVADQVNYNTDAYGLQAVSAQPVARTAVEKMNAPEVKQASPTATAAAEPSLSSQLADWFQANMIWLLGVSILLVALVIFLLFLRPATTEEPIVENVPQERVNASPFMSQDRTDEDVEAAPLDEEAYPTEEETQEEEQPSVRELPRLNEVEEPRDTEAPTLAPNEHTAIIAVGLFGNPDNVQNKLSQLSEQGFSPYSAPEGRNTRVGVNVRYTDESELRKVLRDIKRLHTKSAFVMYKDGERVR
ncbi:MAG: hypothetical protein AAGJ93_01850 [Bacteroidota bacterium]